MHLFAMLDALARVEPRGDEEPLGEDLFRRVGAASRGASMVVLTAGTDASLPAELARYAAVGVSVTLIYADPHSFDPSLRSPSKPIQSAFLDALLGAQVEVYVLSRDDGQRLAPERHHGIRIPA